MKHTIYKLVGIIVFNIITISVSGQIPSNGLLHRFTFNSTWWNTTGTNALAPVNPIFGTDRTGNANAALVIERDINTTASTMISNLPVGASPRTVAMWIKPTDIWPGGDTPFVYGNQANNQSYGLSYKTNELNNFGYSNDLIYTHTNLIQINQWYHIATTYDGTTAKIYLNGVEVASQAKTWNTTGTTFYLGRFFGGGNSFAGSVDELLIYDRALTSEEVEDVFCPAEIIPTFHNLASICEGGTFPAFQTTSLNGFTGTWSPAPNNMSTTTYTFTPGAGQHCATTATMTVTVHPSLVPPIVTTPIENLTICPGQTVTLTASGTGTIEWFNVPIGGTAIHTGSTYTTPVLTNTTTYYIKQHTTGEPTYGCHSERTPVTVTIEPLAIPALTSSVGDLSICSGSVATLMASGTGTIQWLNVIGNVLGTGNTFTTPVLTENASYRIRQYTGDPTTGCYSGQSPLITVEVNQLVTPGFVQVAPICSGAPLSLPTTSQNNVSGTWSPVADNTSTTTYTFIPDAGECVTGIQVTMTVTVNQPITPVFNQIAPVCSGATLSLPTTSTNGISGTWSPVINMTETTSYTFTPHSGCVTTTTMTVEVNSPTIMPIFDPVAPICHGETVTLPTTSVNGITGTWLPAFNNTETTTYTFTPNSGQCGVTATMTVEVNPPTITPTFNQAPSICPFGPMDPLPTTSINGITGTWSPHLNNIQTTTYTFTPHAGQCAHTTTMTIIIGPLEPPVNTTPPENLSVCVGTTTTITLSGAGTIQWFNSLSSPTPLYTGHNYSLTLYNDATYYVRRYIGSCYSERIPVTVTVRPNVSPTFTQVPNICPGAVLEPLPTTSNNGISGTWSPPMNNTQSTTYTFTPNAGQCATGSVMAYIGVNNPDTEPLFDPIPMICAGASNPLYSTSNNGITGTWSPAWDSSTGGVYTFTPDAGSCGTTTQLYVGVNTSQTSPSLPENTTPPADLVVCAGTATTLSVSGMGTVQWFNSPSNPTVLHTGHNYVTPPLYNNTTYYVRQYTGVPMSGCYTARIPITVTVTAIGSIPAFTQISPICPGEIVIFSTTSNNGISGTWSPGLNNTETTTYTFTPNTGHCGIIEATMTIEVVEIDETVSLTGNILTANQNGASYQWLDCNNGNFPVGGETGQTFAPSVNGSYAVQVTKNGCSEISDCINMNVVGMNETLVKNVFIYPNPASYMVTVENIPLESTITVFDITGKAVYTTVATTESIQVKTDTLTNGLYHIQIGNSVFGLVIKKLIISK